MQWGLFAASILVLIGGLYLVVSSDRVQDKPLAIAGRFMSFIGIVSFIVMAAALLPPGR